ncbi:MAG: dienelactone hydrolase family protein [Trueperaceae bacterium]|nr:dienelactone hydrolase family protein [Trueperaceae bacterium]
MKRLLTFFKWLLGIIGVLVLALALSIPLDWFINRKTVDTLTNTVISASQPVKAYVVMPDSSEKLPAVIMIHEFWGLKESLIGKAEALAEEGYVVVAPDTFRGQSANWVPTAITQVLSHKTEQINTDLDTVYAWLSQQPNVDPERIMVMGFCYGGGASLNYSLTNPELRATGIFYGSLVTDAAQLRALPGPVLGIFGEADASIPVDEVKAFEAALQQAGIEHRISLYPDQGHAFVKSIEEIRAGGAPAAAWQEFLAFTANTLKD